MITAGLSTAAWRDLHDVHDRSGVENLAVIMHLV
jgi:hypothetical protein